MSESKQITISGKSFTVPVIYAIGDTIETEGEASALNQTFHEAIRNNLASRFKEHPENLTQAEVDLYAQKFEFGVRSGGGRVGDPVEREALSIASSKVKDAIRVNGKTKLSDYKVGDITLRAKQLLDKDPSIRKLAAEIVSKKQSVAATTLAELGIE